MAYGPERHLKIIILLIIFVIAAGTLGYMLLTGSSLLDCLYMTVITITTVGYEEIFEPSSQLLIFTIILIISGVAVIFYGLTVVMQMAVEGQIRKILGRKRMQKELKKLKNHYILAGYGRVGKIVYGEFKKLGQPVVVIENDPEILDEINKENILHVVGNSTEDETLIEAGIERARGLVSAIPAEADNVYLTLSARQLNPAIKIIARSDTERAERKLFRAGANRVICPHRLGGMRMAYSILRPNVVDFMELESAGKDLDISIEEIIVPTGSNLDGVELKDSDLKRELDLMVVAIKKPDKGIHYYPSASTTIHVGDVLVLLGRKENLAKLDVMSINNT
jgi:voltage-gated potassium channel